MHMILCWFQCALQCCTACVANLWEGLARDARGGSVGRRPSNDVRRSMLAFSLQRCTACVAKLWHGLAREARGGIAGRSSL